VDVIHPVVVVGPTRARAEPKAPGRGGEGPVEVREDDRVVHRETQGAVAVDLDDDVDQFVLTEQSQRPGALGRGDDRASVFQVDGGCFTAPLL